MKKMNLWRFAAMGALAAGVPLALGGVAQAQSPVDVFQLSLVHTHQLSAANSGGNDAWNGIGQSNHTGQHCDASANDGPAITFGPATSGNQGGSCTNTATSSNTASNNSATVTAGAASASNTSSASASQTGTVTVTDPSGHTLVVQATAVGTGQAAFSNSGFNSAGNDIDQSNGTYQSADASANGGAAIGGTSATSGNTGGTASNTASSTNTASGNSASVSTGAASATNNSTSSATQTSTVTVTGP